MHPSPPSFRQLSSTHQQRVKPPLHVGGNHGLLLPFLRRPHLRRLPRSRLAHQQRAQCEVGLISACRISPKHIARWD
jgi:hypothetical protein